MWCGQDQTTNLLTMRLDHGGPGFAVARWRLFVAELPTRCFFKGCAKRRKLGNRARELLVRSLFDVQSQRSGLVAGHGLGNVGGACGSLPVKIGRAAGRERSRISETQ